MALSGPTNTTITVNLDWAGGTPPPSGQGIDVQFDVLSTGIQITHHNGSAITPTTTLLLNNVSANFTIGVVCTTAGTKTIRKRVSAEWNPNIIEDTFTINGTVSTLCSTTLVCADLAAAPRWQFTRGNLQQVGILPGTVNATDATASDSFTAGLGPGADCVTGRAIYSYTALSHKIPTEYGEGYTPTTSDYSFFFGTGLNRTFTDGQFNIFTIDLSGYCPFYAPIGSLTDESGYTGATFLDASFTETTEVWKYNKVTQVYTILATIKAKTPMCCFPSVNQIQLEELCRNNKETYFYFNDTGPACDPNTTKDGSPRYSWSTKVGGYRRIFAADILACLSGSTLDLTISQITDKADISNNVSIGNPAIFTINPAEDTIYTNCLLPINLRLEPIISGQSFTPQYNLFRTNATESTSSTQDSVCRHNMSHYLHLIPYVSSIFTSVAGTWTLNARPSINDPFTVVPRTVNTTNRTLRVIFGEGVQIGHPSAPELKANSRVTVSSKSYETVRADANTAYGAASLGYTYFNLARMFRSGPSFNPADTGSPNFYPIPRGVGVPVNVRFVALHTFEGANCTTTNLNAIRTEFQSTVQLTYNGNIAP